MQNAKPKERIEDVVHTPTPNVISKCLEILYNLTLKLGKPQRRKYSVSKRTMSAPRGSS